jgi:hypothetical protein
MAASHHRQHSPVPLRGGPAAAGARHDRSTPALIVCVIVSRSRCRFPREGQAEARTAHPEISVWLEGGPNHVAMPPIDTSLYRLDQAPLDKPAGDRHRRAGCEDSLPVG